MHEEINAIKYAGCKVITIKVKDEASKVRLCFQDDGGALKQVVGIEEGMRNRLMKIAAPR
ncbi:MAG: anti-sigma regulatory factor (Ser/Thr protein kinase) [Candidatus Azotimanducaceae bacterium]